jgi:exodeoxyribonuclease V gamma subunit
VGSAREPSTVVSELLAAAAAYHASGDADALVLRHPLQPFAPAAFGSGDRRRFSYRAHWHPAAGRLSGMRAPLAPWMDAATVLAPPPDAEVETELSLDALRRFLMAPAEQFLRQRLGLRLPELEDAGEDVEALRAPGRGLARSQLQRAVFDALLAGDGGDALQAALRARGLLPSGPLGRRALAEVMQEVLPYAECFAAWRGDARAQARAIPLEVAIDGLRLHGRIADAWPQGIARLRFGAPNGPSVLRNGLDWLFASAAGEALAFFEFHADKERGVGPHQRPPLDPAQARDALRVLVGLHAKGLRQPLPFAPRSAWLYYSAANAERGTRAANAKRGIEAARDQWQGGDRQWAEGGEPALALALRARDPFGDRDALREFVATAQSVFAAVTSGLPNAPEPDEAAIAGAPLDGDDDE